MVEQMLQTLSYPPIQRAVIACVLCGASCALLSVFVVLMKMPLIGVSMSHAAFAGAVLGLLLDVNPFLSGLIMCLLVAAILGPLSDRTDIAPENMLGILFSFLMGIAVLGMGILTKTKAGALNLMWGSLLTLSEPDIWVLLTAVTLLLILFVILFFKEIRVVLFNRRLAASSGVPERMIYYLLLFLTGAVISSNLATVGGLLIFALLVQPGATALQLTYNLKSFFLISAASGIAACISGLVISYIFDISTGASVVLTATTIFAIAYIFSPKRRSTKIEERKTPFENDAG